MAYLPEMRNRASTNIGSMNSEQITPLMRMITGLAEGQLSDQYGDDIQQIGQYTANRADPFAAHRPYFGGRIRDFYNDPSSFVTTDPAAQYNMQRVMDATNRANAASGNFFSGNRMLELQQNASGLAANEYAAEMERMMRMAGAYSDPSTAALAASKYFDIAAQQPMNRGAGYAYGVGSFIDELLRGSQGTQSGGWGGLINGLVSGGGLDGRGNRGFIGDIGGLFTGDYGTTNNYGTTFADDGSSYDLMPEIPLLIKDKKCQHKHQHILIVTEMLHGTI